MSPKDTGGLADLEAEHTPAAIETRLRTPVSHSYLRDFIYGAVDGADPYDCRL
jgi:hypothetical protein